MRAINRYLLLALCALCSSLAVADDTAIAQVNNEVAQKAQQIDEKYGVLMDYLERNSLKLRLIAAKAVANNNSDKSVEALTSQAIATYEITDPDDQRKLLFEIESAVQTQKSSGNGNGDDPAN